MKKNNLRVLVIISMLAAIAIILRFIEFPIIPITPWLKIDISLIIPSLAIVLIGLKEGLIIQIVKALILYIIKPGNPIGNTIELVSGIIFILLIYVFYKKYKNNNKAWRICVVAIIISLVMTLLNAVLFTPIYAKYMGFPLDDFIGYSSSLAHDATDAIFNIKSGVGKLLYNLYDYDGSTYSYIKMIVIMYIPFNLIKYIMLAIILELLLKSRALLNVMKKIEN